MPVFFVDQGQVRDGAVRITGTLLRHLQGSLRVQSGEELVLIVPRSRRYRVRVDHVDSKGLVGLVLEEQVVPALAGPQVVLAQSILKGEHMDWLIQKASELGAAQIVPIVSHHSVVRPRTDRVKIQHERWQRIALEAAQQSERYDIPNIEVPIEADSFFSNQSAPDLRLILSERCHGQSISSLRLPSGWNDRIVVAVGPEGGWRFEELALAGRCGFVSVSLGSRILRAETAGLAAVTLLQSRLGQLE